MSKHKWSNRQLFFLLIAQAFFFLIAFAVVAIATQGPIEQQAGQLTSIEHPGLAALAQPAGSSMPAAGGIHQASASSDLPGPLQQLPPTTLQVVIVSSPWAVLDHNNPSGTGEEVPKVFVVEAVVTNTGTNPAVDVVLNLDYNEDPLYNWVLLPGQDPDRTVDELAAGEAYHAYWFARYSTIIGASHQYTVTAQAENASQAATSNNYYGNPEAGKTVKTRSHQSTGNSGVAQVSANIVVGVAFTVTVQYDLGTKPQDAIFSPVGNTDFDASAYRLLASEVRLYNDAGTEGQTIYDRLYFPTLPSFADNAQATFTFIAVTPANTRLCPYTGVGYQSTRKYDQFYCEGARIIPITGTLSLSMTKEVSSLTIQQNQLLTYTIRYTNNGELPLQYVWIWDDIDTGIASLISDTIDPASDPDETTDSRVAWYLDSVPASGQAGSTGTLTFTILIDGNGQDLADGTLLVNHAFFGVNPGSLPAGSALTSTVTTTIQAPTVAVSKTDGQATAEPGDALVYTLRITNSGSVAATGLIITDVLPTDVNYNDLDATPDETDRTGQTLTWNDLGPIPPGGGTVLITIPVAVGAKVPDGTFLTDMMTVNYQNPAGWVFATKTAQDTTTVNAPILTITKSDSPDPVLTGHLITYTLQYANTGPAEATHVVITDRVPLSTTYNVCSGASCGESNGIVSWDIGTVPSNTNATVRFSVWVSDTLDTGTLIRNDDYGIVADQTDFIAGPPVTTYVNRNAGVIDGYTFIDRDGDGFYDDGDDGTLSGITVTLDFASLPPVTTTTSITGYYRFRVEIEEPISITAALPDGYFRTTAGTVITESALEITQTINFGYAPITSTFGVIYGTVFEDADHDGVRELGEKGLQGVAVSSGEAVNSPASTDNFGRYTLRFTSADAVTVTETNPPFYVSTTPDVVHTDVVIGSSNGSPIDFGDFLGIKITGQVFDDADVDGVKDGAEGGVPGATVTADGESHLTGSTGVYTLYITPEDSNPIPIVETDPAGYISTNAVPGSGMTRIDANTLLIASPISGTVYSDGDFGDVLATNAITISGQVWNDNGAGGGGLANGLRDGTEPGLAGALVSLSSGLTQTTTSDGLFRLYAPPDQSITVTETNPAGYASTNAIPGNNASKVDNDTLIVSALSGSSTSADNLFGDVLASSVAIITGTVFDDANENGMLDTGEAGLAGVTVTLEIRDGNTIAVLTDSAGQYQFAVAPSIDIRITSAGPGGAYYPTTLPSVVERSPAAGGHLVVHFGYSDDTDVAVIYGIVFDDLNSNGRQEFGELGLAGASIRLNAGKPMTTSGAVNGSVAGSFAFTVTQVSVYDLHETNPPGYRSTTPDDINVPVPLLGDSYYADFGDTKEPGVATIYGTVFRDMNCNGTQESNEPGLPGVVISVTIGGGTGVLTTTTKSYGQYSYGFEVGEAGIHTVIEQDPALPGYRSTTPDQIVVNIVLGRSYRVNFGDTDDLVCSNIMGIVFYDEDGDGKQDLLAEMGIKDVTVTLSSGPATSTGDYGEYTFPIDAPGYVQVIETDPENYHSTTPNTVTVDVEVGQVYIVNFGDNGNAFVASIFGTVFNDQNVNGVRDGTELGLQGVTVHITDTVPGIPSPYVTNIWGQYTFQIDDTGTYTVTETDPAGYVSTIAIPGDPAVTRVDNNTLRAQVSSLGIDLGDNLFGDVLASQAITISGYVWNDNGAGGGIAGDGVWDGSEPGLAGAVVSLSSGLAQTTGSDGAFLLHGPTGQVITVIETNPTGYVSTNAIPDDETASKVNDDELTVDALGGGETSAGNLFGDVLPADLAVDKQDSHDPASAGAVLTYTLFYANNGPSYAQDVYITDTLDSDVTYGGVVSQPSGWTGPTPDAGPPTTLTWYTPALAAGASGTIVFTVTIDADLASGETIVNSVVITSNLPDTSSLNNKATETTEIATQADLAIAKSDDPDPVAAGATLTYTLVYANNGPSDAQSVSITDTLDSGVTFGGVVSEDPPLPSFTQDGKSLVWYTPTLAAGASGTIVFTATVEPDAIGSVLNSVVITSSTPDTHIKNNSDSERTVIGAPDLATIFGYVFNDANGNGEFDDDEVAIEGATVTLDGSETTATRSDGLYFFIISVPGVHIVVETDPDGYFSTTPNEVHVEVALGNSYQVDFGDAPDTSGFAAIYGTVFEDLDGDGEFDGDEVGIQGVTVTLDGSETAITDEYGSYSFSTAAEGVHTVVETDPDGYFSTTPNEVHVEVALGNGYQVDFGDAPDTSGFAAIYGTVFEDLDGDGEFDGDEVGIQGVTVTLDGSETAITDEYGSYSFSTAAEGVHTVVETDPDGYFSTTPNEVHVEVALGNSYQVDFGDAPDTSGFAAIYGTVFDDLDSDGEWDDNELGIRGVEVRLDGSEPPAITNRFGSYSFRIDTAGLHTVVETDPDGYFSTTPNEVHVEVALGNGYQVDFGDVLAGICTCLPDSYEPDDTVTEAKELVIGVKQAHDFCDDAIDWVSFTAEASRLYTITTSSWGQRADTFLGLFATDGLTLLAANDDFEGTEDYSSRIVWQAPGSGVYYVRTTNRAGLTGCVTDYELWVEESAQKKYYIHLPLVARAFTQTAAPNIVSEAAPETPSEQEAVFSPTGIISHTCPDGYELDDTWEQAQPIELGVTQVHSFDSNPVFYAADKDFVWFELARGRTITFTITAVTNTQTLLELYDEYGAALNVTGTTQLVWTPTTSGRYYLSISPLATTFGCIDASGYRLLAEMPARAVVYLPIVMRSYAGP